MIPKYARLFLLVFCSGFYLNAFSSEANIPFNFVANTPAVADEVNKNFSALKAAIDDNNVRLASLENRQIKGMPVRCHVWINSALVDQNVPMTCNTVDGNEYINVPANQYLYVTDIIVRPRLTSQTSVAASVRIWQDNVSASTGCNETSVIGSFLTDQFITLADTTTSGQVHIPYNTPYLVLTPNDCLAVYTSTTGGLIVDISGYQYDQIF